MKSEDRQSAAHVENESQEDDESSVGSEEYHYTFSGPRAKFGIVPDRFLEREDISDTGSGAVASGGAPDSTSVTNDNQADSDDISL